MNSSNRGSGEVGCGGSRRTWVRGCRVPDRSLWPVLHASWLHVDVRLGDGLQGTSFHRFYLRRCCGSRNGGKVRPLLSPAALVEAVEQVCGRGNRLGGSDSGRGHSECPSGRRDGRWANMGPGFRGAVDDRDRRGLFSSSGQTEY